MNSPASSRHPELPRKKRRPRDEESDESSDYPSEVDKEDGDYTLVVSRKVKRRMRRAASSGESSASTILTTVPRHLTVVYAPVILSHNLTTISKRALSTFLEKLAPEQILEVRLNPRRNVVAVDAANQHIIEKLLQVTDICGIQVRPYIPRGPHTSVGVISGVDADIPDDELMKEITATKDVLHVHRLGSSLCVKVVFAGDALPSHVKAGFIRYPVRPFVPRATQCTKCWAFGHVQGTCGKPATCSRCGTSHDHGVCTTEAAKCVNCSGAHDANSKECPRLRKETAVLKRMARDHSTRREAATVLRRKHSRQRRGRKVAARSHEPPRPSQTRSVPAPLKESSSMLRRPTKIPNDRPATSNAETWPSLETPVQKLQGHATTRNREEIAAFSNDTTEEQISNMLKTLISVLRDFIGKKRTPMARVATQVLDAIIPLLGPI